MLMQTVLKVKTCKVCGKEFTPARPMQSVCSPRCAAKLGKLKKAADRRETRAKKEAIKTLPTLLKEAQVAFNAYIRLRDRDQPCISCGAPAKADYGYQKGRDAGHYRSVGSAPQVRFNANNVHAQCVKCNQWKAGNVVDYRINLIARIGLPAVEALEADSEVHKWTKDEVRLIRDTYRALVKSMKKETA